MSRSRRYGEDLTYAEAHRFELPALYSRIGHRLDLANRDWTEFCHWCKAPLLIYEDVRDVGQNLLDKGVTVTRKLGQMADVPALLLAWQIERPADVQQEIDKLNRQVQQLQRTSINGFKVRPLYPRSEQRLIPLTVEQWWTWIAFVHRAHHHLCSKAQGRELALNERRLEEALEKHPLYQPTLFGDEMVRWRTA